MYQITGNTYPHRAMLKAAGLRWNAVSKAWETPNFELAQQVVLRGAGLRLNGAAPLPVEVLPQRRAWPKQEPVEDIRIEFPSRGATYCHQEYGVYKYGVYPRSSVLAGQQSRHFLDRFETPGGSEGRLPHGA